MTDLHMTLLFPSIPIGIYLLFEYVFDRPDDDDDGGGGMMIPAYNPTQ